MILLERARTGAAALRERSQAWTDLTMVVVNADNYRKPPWQVGVELHAIAAWLRPHFIDVVEALGNDLPQIDGYRLIRDTSRPSRENIAAYIRDDLPLSHVTWHDMEHGWPRTEGPGFHEPRSFLTYRVARLRRGVAHDPDPRAQGPARAEHRKALRRWLLRRPLWPVLLGEDSNGNAPDLMRWTRVRRFGNKVDVVLARRVLRGRATYVREVPRTDARGTVRFMGDHQHFLVAGFTIATRYLRPRQPRTTDPRLSEVPT